MKIYGLTGMSGAGKSTVCDSFENAGFLIIDCDRLAREVVRKGRPCLDKLHRLFGDSVITKDGELDRRAMGNIVFSHSDKLALLNNTIYPYITYEVISMCGNTDKRFVLLIMLRDNITRESAEKRLGSQHDAEYYKSKSDFCIENNGDIDTLKAKADATARKIINGN